MTEIVCCCGLSEGENLDCERCEFIRKVESLTVQRDDLLAACKAYLYAMEHYGHPDKTDRLMRTAIKKAKGE